MQSAPLCASQIHHLATLSTRRDGADHVHQSLAGVIAILQQDMDEVDSLLKRLESRGSSCSIAASDLVNAGGKRIRPALAILSFRIASRGGRSPQIIELGAAVELLHTATLLHDDVIDEATIRRSQPAARIAWGNAVSVIAGDLLLVQALDMVHSLGEPRLDSLMNSTLRQLVEGEIEQLDRRGKLDMDAATFERVAGRKTASLFVLASVGGALLAGAGSLAMEALERVAKATGLAFQLGDDLLDLCSSPEVLGKAVGRDLATGSATLPIAELLSREPALSRAIEAHMQQDATGTLPERMAAELLQIGARPGALDRSRALVGRYAQQASDALAQLPACAEREALQGVVDMLFARGATVGIEG